MKVSKAAKSEKSGKPVSSLTEKAASAAAKAITEGLQKAMQNKAEEDDDEDDESDDEEEVRLPSLSLLEVVFVIPASV